MRLRAYRPNDGPVLAALFRDTVRSINARDYDADQITAWISGCRDLDAWGRSFASHTTVVAEEGETVVGFGDIDAAGYLDRLYVHCDFQRRGIAAAICDVLEQATKTGSIVTHASITAKGFFEKRGYRVVKEQQVLRRGVALTNYIMERKLHHPR